MTPKSKVNNFQRLTTSDRDQIIQLFKSGVSVVKIAEKLNCSRPTIYSAVQHLSKASDLSKQFSIRMHPLEIEALDKVFLRYGIEKRSAGIRKLMRAAGGFFEERDDIAAEWKEVRKQLDGMANNLNQIATACNTGKVDMKGELPGEYKKLSRKYYELSDVLSQTFDAVNRQTLVDNHLENVLVG